MPLTAGIVGLPNVGKSTLFNAITQAEAEAANYAFCTIEPNVGVVNVPDERLVKMAELIQPKRVVPTICQFVDIAGLVKGASRGEGLGNKFLSHIREVDAIIHVVRCFEDDQIEHVAGRVDPVDDIETITLELILSDLQTVEKRMDRVQKQKKSGDKEAIQEYEVLQKIQILLHEGMPARMASLSEDEKSIIKNVDLLTMKNVLYVCNVSEEEALIGENPNVQAVQEIAEKENAEVITISAQLESEIVALEGEERDAFLDEIGFTQPGLDRLIAATYQLLGLITYFTAGEKEVRAWTIKKGTKAPQAAGVIHSDFERFFIRAEVMNYQDLIQYGSTRQVREQGLLRLEGKDYIVQDGDVINFLTQKG